MNYLAALLITASLTLCQPARAGDGVVYRGQAGPGKGKHVVLLAGDEEYRSEEALPMLGKVLAQRHGFDCTVLFPINPADGTIDPLVKDNTPGLEALDKADLLILWIRFREYPDAQMKHFVDYLNSGKPIIGLRTATHAFAYDQHKGSPYAKYDYRSKEWPGGFGQQVLGDTWVNHHGDHGKQSTRGVLNAKVKDHPILKGVADIWGPTDVYAITHLPAEATVLVYGQVLEGMNPTDKPVAGPKNEPMMPLIWFRNYKGETGNTSKIVTTTIGAAVDLQSEDLRRLLVNASYWAVGLADKIPPKANVDYVGEYKPSWFGFGKFQKGKGVSSYY